MGIRTYGTCILRAGARQRACGVFPDLVFTRISFSRVEPWLCGFGEFTLHLTTQTMVISKWIPLTLYYSIAKYFLKTPIFRKFVHISLNFYLRKSACLNLQNFVYYWESYKSFVGKNHLTCIPFWCLMITF